jgi:hypothetical protein
MARFFSNHLEVVTNTKFVPRNDEQQAIIVKDSN